MLSLFLDCKTQQLLIYHFGRVDEGKGKIRYEFTLKNSLIAKFLVHFDIIFDINS